MISDQLFNEIARGRQGLNHGISMGMPKLEQIIDLEPFQSLLSYL